MATVASQQQRPAIGHVGAELTVLKRHGDGAVGHLLRQEEARGKARHERKAAKYARHNALAVRATEVALVGPRPRGNGVGQQVARALDERPHGELFVVESHAKLPVAPRVGKVGVREHAVQDEDDDLKEGDDAKDARQVAEVEERALDQREGVLVLLVLPDGEEVEARDEEAEEGEDDVDRREDG